MNAKLPTLPFANDAFDMVLSANFLFTIATIWVGKIVQSKYHITIAQKSWKNICKGKKIKNRQTVYDQRIY
jgi:hypothetical protein